MSAQISTVAAELGVAPADILVIVNQLSEIDTDDTIDANHPVRAGDVIETRDGVWGNVWLTPEAIRALYEQFHGDPEKLYRHHGIR